MKKYIFIMLLFCIMGIEAQAQFANTTGMSSYNELTGATSLNGSTVWSNSSIYPIYLPFNFGIYGETYTALSVMAGGGLNFPGLGVKNLNVFWIPFGGGYMLKDKGTTSSLSPIGYTITGASGSQVLKVQWQNAGFVQVGDSASASDFIDYQIWLFESDSHIEIHFGSSSTSIITYGGPGSADGTELIFQFDTCSDLFTIEGPANLPSYSFTNGCNPFATNIDGTPDSGIVYNIHSTTTGINSLTEKKVDIALYPNPVNENLVISGLSETIAGTDITITNTIGSICFDEVIRPASGTITIPVERFASGIYYVKIRTGNGAFVVREFVKQ